MADDKVFLKRFIKDLLDSYVYFFSYLNHKFVIKTSEIWSQIHQKALKHVKMPDHFQNLMTVLSPVICIHYTQTYWSLR